jgi:NADH-quinone oxidoreductase subunit M
MIERLLNTLRDNVALMMTVLPFVGAGLVALSARLGIESIRRTALTNVLLTASLAVLMVASYDPAARYHNTKSKTADGPPRTIQMISRVSLWGGAGDDDTPVVGFPAIRCALGVDGLSLWMIALVPFVMIPSVLAGPSRDSDQPAAFYALLLVVEGATIGAFAALDVISFCAFLELALLATYFLIGGWGGHERRRIATKFLLCNLAGSLLVFVGLAGLVTSHYWMSGLMTGGDPQITFSIARLTHRVAYWARLETTAEYWESVSRWAIPALLVGFAIRMPVFPFHTWLPGSNLESPNAVSVLSTAVGMKVGVYGMVRFVLPLFTAGGAFNGPAPNESIAFLTSTVMTVAVVGVVFAGLLTLGQGDLSKLASYACVVQMGLCLAGLFSLNTAGVTGGWLLAIAHVPAIAVVLFLTGILERTYQTREVTAICGLAARSPRLAICYAIGAFSLAAVPLLGGFAGQSLVLFGLFQVSPKLTIWAILGSFLLVWAFAWLMQRVFLGRLQEPLPDAGLFEKMQSSGKPGGNVVFSFAVTGNNETPRDLSRSELASVLPLVVIIFWIGIYPQFFVDRMRPTLAPLLAGDPHAVSAMDDSQPSKQELTTKARRHKETDWPQKGTRVTK